MRHRFLKLLKPFLLLFGVCLLASTSKANMDTMMGNMFNNVLMNGTPGGIYETQSRGIIAGPSAYARTKISNVQLLSFNPPRIKADCGGIDAYLGSFSFISKDQLVTFLRQTAQAAIPYAFGVALKALCNPCHDVMSQLQAISNAVNQTNLNSCNTAKALVDAMDIPGNVAKLKDQFNASDVAIEAGATSDTQEGMFNPLRNALSVVAKDAPAKVTETTGNITWKVLANSSLANWYGTTYSAAGGASIQELIMSLVGSRIRVFIDVNGEQVAINYPLTPLVNFRTFLEGGQTQIWSCGTELGPDECLRPTIATVTVKGFTPLVKETLERIKLKIAERDVSTLSDPDKIFLTRAPGSVGTHIVGLSVNQASLDYYLNAASDYIAIEVTSHFLTDIRAALSAATGKEFRDSEVSSLSQRLDDLQRSMSDSVVESYARLASVEKNIQIVNLIRASTSAANGRSAKVVSVR